MITKRSFLSVAVASLLGLFASEGHAQIYPNRPIKMIVPFPPGGPIDVIGRLIAEQMSTSLGQRVFIENRPGAGATVGTAAAANAGPDGYTLLFAPSAALAVSPVLYKNAGYDPVKSFVPIAMVSSGSLLLAVGPSVPAKSVKELVAYAKANPGKLNYGSALGTAPHIAWALFNQQTGSNVVYIPYKGNAQAITDLLGGQVHMNIDAPATLLPHIAEGKLRPLAVTGAERDSNLPELPTMVESGYPEFVMTFWTGVAAPAGTPRPLVEQVNKAVNAALQSPEVADGFKKFRVVAKPGSPEAFGEFIAAEAKKWSTVIRSAGIELN
jgi:tripartite-type tricarboxylate transporter receptor subunit TctC